MASIRSIKRKKSRANTADPLAEFQEKLAHDPAYKDMHLIRNAKGEVKMSDVLETLVEPFADDADSLDAHTKLITLGVIAWNLALLPIKERDKEIDEVLAAFGDISKEDKRMLKDVLKTLVARKLHLFADNQRSILDFKLTDQGNAWHLSVVSTMSKQP